MGTDLESVLEDIKALKDHLKYFAECRGNYKYTNIATQINTSIDTLMNLAKLIENTEEDKNE
jgi:hypothetical protein